MRASPGIRTLTKGLPLGALLLLASCVSMIAGQESDVARTWERARIYLPRSSRYLTPAQVSGGDLRPTVLFLHGCTGIIAGSERWAATLSGAGYAVAMPDSFARYHRVRNCDPKTYSTGLFPEAREMRQEEIKYALRMLQDSPWADSRKLFLMGHSEGGAAVARWEGNGFSGLIISGNRCRGGVRASRAIAVLAINFASDPWARGRDHVTCAYQFGGRENAKEVILPGKGHDTSRSAEARSAVLSFLKAQTSGG